MKEQIKKLREITGAGVMEYRKSFNGVNGDFDKAKAIIYERGLVKAEKRANVPPAPVFYGLIFTMSG